MALVIALGMGLVVLLFFRDSPEECGLTMDGNKAAGSAAPAKPKSTERSFTRAQALRTSAFWAVTLCLATQALLITGITFHIVDIGATVGVQRAAAVAIFLPMAVVSVVAAMIGGIMGDRLPVRALLLATMAGLGCGIIGVVHLDGYAWLAIVGLGISSGLFSPVSTIAYPRFFGRRHLGAIAGAEMMILVAASALGPTLLATSRAWVEAYSPALYASLLMPATGILLALTFRSPVAPLDPEEATTDS